MTSGWTAQNIPASDGFTSWTGHVSLEGWWKCCRCSREVNSNIWNNDCPDCSHTKCDSCTDVEQQPPITVQDGHAPAMTDWWEGYDSQSGAVDFERHGNGCPVCNQKHCGGCEVVD